jgi:hypothetical protein
MNGKKIYRKMGSDTAHFLFKDSITGRWNFVDVSNSNEDVLAPQYHPQGEEGFADPRQTRDPFAPLAYYSKENLLNAFENGAACIRSNMSASLPNDNAVCWQVISDDGPEASKWEEDLRIKITEGAGVQPNCVKFMGHNLSRKEYMGTYVKIEGRMVHGAPIYRQLNLDDGKMEDEEQLGAAENDSDAYEDCQAFGFSTHAEMESCKAMGFSASQKAAYDEFLSFGFQSKEDYDEYLVDRKGRFCYRCSATGRWLLVDDGDEASFSLNAAAFRTQSSIDMPSNEGAVWEFLGPDPEGESRWIVDVELKCKMRSSPEEEDTSDEEEEAQTGNMIDAEIEEKEKEEESVEARLERERKERDNKLSKIAAEIKLAERRGREIAKERKHLHEEDSSSKIERAARSLNIISLLIEEANQFVESVYCYQRGMRASLLKAPGAREDDADAPFVGIDGTVKALDASGSYLVQLDGHKPTKAISDQLDTSTHRPSVIYGFCPGAELAVFIRKSKGELENWVDCSVLHIAEQEEGGVCTVLLMDPPTAISSAPPPKTSSGYGMTSSISPPKPEDNGPSTAELVLNRSNHYRRCLRQHQYAAERITYFDEIGDVPGSLCSTVVDPATGKALDVRRDLLRYLELRSDACGTERFRNVEDIASFMARPISPDCRGRGLTRLVPSLIHGPAGSGKSWLMRQWLCLVADTTSTDRSDGAVENNRMVPLLIDANQLQFVLNGNGDSGAGNRGFSGPDGLDGFMNGRRSLLRAYLERAFGPGGVGAVGVGGGDNSSKSSGDQHSRMKFLLDALESQRLVVGIDGLEQAGDRKGSLEIAIVDELIARGCQVLATIRTECLTDETGANGSTPWRTFELQPLSKEQQEQLVCERLGSSNGNVIFVDMISRCDEGKAVMDGLFADAATGEHASPISFDHNGARIYKGIEGIRDIGRGSHRPSQDGSWRDTDFRRNCHELHRLAVKAKASIASELEAALGTAINHANNDGIIYNYEVIVNELKAESWVAANARKRENLHQASIGVATVLDCCSAEILCGPSLDSIQKALAALRVHPRFRVVRVKNLFCPPNIEVQRFRRVLVGLRVLDIEEAVSPTDTHHRPSEAKSHIVEVTLHLRHFFETFHAQPRLYKVNESLLSIHAREN